VVRWVAVHWISQFWGRYSPTRQWLEEFTLSPFRQRNSVSGNLVDHIRFDSTVTELQDLGVISRCDTIRGNAKAEVQNNPCRYISFPLSDELIFPWQISITSSSTVNVSLFLIHQVTERLWFTSAPVDSWHIANSWRANILSSRRFQKLAQLKASLLVENCTRDRHAAAGQRIRSCVIASTRTPSERHAGELLIGSVEGSPM
jgi:hypothetical protein